MKIIKLKGKSYHVGPAGYLLNNSRWDEFFAEGMAPLLKIPGGLTKKHWKIINFIRDTFKETRRCPTVYETCKANELTLNDLKELFPTGYQRGACKISGITFRHGYNKYSWVERLLESEQSDVKKTYQMDDLGFLKNPSDWDENFAANVAHDKEKHGELTDSHWKVIHFLRESFKNSKEIPTLYETCEALNIELNELEKLFPDGYHRGAVRISGL